MAIEKSKTELVEEEHWRSHLGEPHPTPSLKYKKDEYNKKANNVFGGVEIHRGSFVIIRELKPKKSGEVQGYMLGRVLDMENQETGWWDLETTLIVHIIGVSNDSLSHHLDRLRSTRIHKFGWFGGREVVKVGKENWSDYIPGSKGK